MKIFRLLIITLAVVLTACSDDPKGPTVKAVERTVLVYMAANNSLGTYNFDSNDLAEMRKAAAAGALGDNRLLVFHAASGGKCSLFEITPDGDVPVAEYDATADNLSSIHAARMLQVVGDARSHAPSDQFGIILWSHGNGWLEDGISEPGFASAGQIAAGAHTPSPKSWGEDRGRRMNITTLASVLGRIKSDFVYFDCCYMASVEVAYQLRATTPLIVASCTELPADGMPYDRTLPYIMAPGKADLVGAARQTFGYYSTLPDAFDRTCTMSVISTAGLDRLAEAAAAIHAAAPALIPDGYTGQPFMTTSACWYYDLQHYMHALAAGTANASALSTAFDSALGQCILYADATPYIWDEVAIDAHCGLSTYIPRRPDLISQKGYLGLEWPQRVLGL